MHLSRRLSLPRGVLRGSFSTYTGHRVNSFPRPALMGMDVIDAGHGDTCLRAIDSFAASS